MVSVLNVNGTRGEITPFMHARMDTEFYQAGFAQCLNTVITRYGPHTRAPGTLYYGDTKDSEEVKLVAFEFSETQVYILECGPNYIRFWTPDGQVVDGGSPYEIASPFAAPDLATLHGRQSGDAIYLFSRTKRPHILKRNGETDWAIEPYDPEDGPYLDNNDTTTTLALDYASSVVPRMTSNDTYTGAAPDLGTVHVESSNGSGSVWEIFTRKKDINVTVGGQTGIIKVSLSHAMVMDNYAIMAGSLNAGHDSMFTQWDIQGSVDNVNWVTLDSRDNEKGWAGSETRFYETGNKIAFLHYRIVYSGGSGSDPEYVTTEVGGWYMHRADEPPGGINASSTVGINDGAGFQATDVGRSIRVKGSDGRWRWGAISAVETPTRVRASLKGHAFWEQGPIQDWALGAWSEGLGWPATGRFYEDRLALASWPGDPIGVALSVSADYDNFRTSDPLVDDDGIKIRLTGGRLDPIHWLADAGSLMGGTGGGLRSIGSRNNAEVLKHDNVRQKLETGVAASALQPVHVESVHLFMDSLRRRLYETGYSYEADGYVAREVSVLNDHLFEVGVGRVEYVDAPYRYVVARRDDGKLVLFAYDRDQKIAGGTLVDYGGFVEDICVLPGSEYPELWLIVRRVVNGEERRHVEKVAPFYNGRTRPSDMPIYAACAYTYDGATTGGLSGLTALAGKTVGIWADGRDIGDADVSGTGSITLPYSVTASRIVVGLRLPWRLQSLPLPTAQSGQDGGLNRKLRIASITVDTFESARVYAGGTKAVELLRHEDDVELDPSAPEPVRTKKLTVPVEGSWTDDGVFVIEGDSMFPATIRGVSLEVEMEP